MKRSKRIIRRRRFLNIGIAAAGTVFLFGSRNPETSDEMVDFIAADGKRYRVPRSAVGKEIDSRKLNSHRSLKNWLKKHRNG